jgi:hypothetical protein
MGVWECVGNGVVANRHRKRPQKTEDDNCLDQPSSRPSRHPLPTTPPRRVSGWSGAGVGMVGTTP